MEKKNPAEGGASKPGLGHAGAAGTLPPWDGEG